MVFSILQHLPIQPFTYLPSPYPILHSFNLSLSNPSLIYPLPTQSFNPLTFSYSTLYSFNLSISNPSLLNPFHIQPFTPSTSPYPTLIFFNLSIQPFTRSLYPTLLFFNLSLSNLLLLYPSLRNSLRLNLSLYPILYFLTSLVSIQPFTPLIFLSNPLLFNLS